MGRLVGLPAGDVRRGWIDGTMHVCLIFAITAASVSNFPWITRVLRKSSIDPASIHLQTFSNKSGNRKDL